MLTTNTKLQSSKHLRNSIYVYENTLSQYVLIGKKYPFGAQTGIFRENHRSLCRQVISSRGFDEAW